MAIVYLLTNTANGKLYVGKTKMSLDHRWYEHVRAATTGSQLALHRAIRKHGRDSFTRRVLSEHPTEAQALAAERDQIVALGTMGPAGYNLTEGGIGTVGYKHTPAELTKRSVTMTEAWRDPAFRERASAAQKVAKSKPEYKAKASASQKLANTPELRARKAKAVAASWRDPEAHAARVAAIKASRTPEMIAAISAHHKALFNTPEMKARMSEAAKARVAASAEKLAAMKARPCSKCGSPRVTLADGTVRCNVCHANKERKRQADKRAVLAYVPAMEPKEHEAPATGADRGEGVAVPADGIEREFAFDGSPLVEAPLPLFEADGSC